MIIAVPVEMGVQAGVPLFFEERPKISQKICLQPWLLIVSAHPNFRTFQRPFHKVSTNKGIEVNGIVQMVL